ncbi:threonine--tRNA ligase [Criibacterium bergeronii]|uniref:Threonine--tRNA ligase n=1 Tax=Criibacterium bergeronii TaxID=1871336 RepID=A0A371IMD4_9FIRM|nr:threonine--tRNA ligase [Criibacterium bergeronii]RDY21659.1 threonine--tRNA ligase [Criibacterium bergeronii]
MIKITLQGKNEKSYDAPVSALDVAKSISDGFARSVLAVKVNGESKDLTTVIDKDSNLEFLKFEDKEGKEVFWHTSTHIMAQAIKRLYPQAKLGTGPAVDNGFYYDIDLDTPLTQEELTKIEEEMKKIVKENLEIKRSELSRQDALDLFKKRNETYKIEIIEGIPQDAAISIYTQGEYIDLCSGPHLMSTKYVKAFKLTSVAGAYWRADAKNKQLQRVYGISFEKKKDLDDYLNMLEEAKLRDHRKLGKELDLFSMHEEGPGFPFFHAKGMVLRNILESFWRQEHTKRGYDEIKTPLILNEALWHQSGHWDHYKENMYFTKIDDADYAIKPMNCPGSILIYNSHKFSYKDLPLRWAEMGQVHRHELSGALHGLMRVRTFTQDDAHLYVLPSQVTDELVGIMELEDYVYNIFGFKYHVELSTRPENSMGTEEQWEIATNGLIEALKRKGVDYVVNEGDGAFYGPKIDFHLEDAIGRTWQCGTIQLDFQLPERFDMTYTDSNDEKQRPIMIHRTVFGSMERFIGILIEHFAGKFPAWLAPVQIKVLPISDKFLDYSKKVAAELKAQGFRVELDTRAEKIGFKIREAQLEKVPYMLVIGEKEVESSNISVRSRDMGELGAMSIQDFITKLKEEVETKKILSK